MSPNSKLFAVLATTLIAIGAGSSKLTDFRIHSKPSAKDQIEPDQHRIFVSSSTFSGAINKIRQKPHAESLGAADQICASLAKNSGLKSNYVALMASSSSDIFDQLKLRNRSLERLGNVVMVDEKGNQIIVADDLMDLFETESKPLLNPINLDENGKKLITGTVMTGSLWDGTHFQSCENWSSSSNTKFAQVGIIGGEKSQWLSHSSKQIGQNANGRCGRKHHIYCISL